MNNKGDAIRIILFILLIVFVLVYYVFEASLREIGEWLIENGGTVIWGIIILNFVLLIRKKAGEATKGKSQSVFKKIMEQIQEQQQKKRLK
ncbi:MAG: hypothetical protein ABH833_01115 [Parcubacteria group bacterium]